MGYASLVLTFGAGFFLGIFLIGQILICVRFAIPTAASWRRLGILRGGGPLSRYRWSALLLGLFGIGIAILILRVFPDDAPIVGAGALLATLVAIPGSGRTAENVADFVEGNRDALDEERLAALTVGVGAAAPSRRPTR
jgi:hypothetical protein